MRFKLFFIAIMAFAVVMVGGGATYATANSAAPVSKWAHVGGDPFVFGGVHSVSEVKSLLASAKGQSGLQSLGLSSLQAQAAKTAKVTDCRIYGWQRIGAMLFGRGVKHNVQLTDQRYAQNGLPSYCFSVPVGSVSKGTTRSAERVVKTVKHKNGSKTVTYSWTETTAMVVTYQKVAVPRICANISTLGTWKRVTKMSLKRTRTETVPGKPKPPVPPVTPPTPPVTPPVVPPTTPISYSCEITSAVVAADRHTVTVTTRYTGNPTSASTIDWGDGTTTAFSTPATRTYDKDTGKRVTVTLVYADGAKNAVCNTEWNNPPLPPSAKHYECTASFDQHEIKLGESVRLTVNPNGPAVKIVINWSDGASVVVNQPEDGGYQPNEEGPFSGTATVTYDNGTTSECGDHIVVKPCPEPPKVCPEGTHGDYPHCVPDKPDCKKGEQWDKDKGKCVPCPEPTPPPKPTWVTGHGEARANCPKTGQELYVQKDVTLPGSQYTQEDADDQAQQLAEAELNKQLEDCDCPPDQGGKSGKDNNDGKGKGGYKN